MSGAGRHLRLVPPSAPEAEKILPEEKPMPPGAALAESAQEVVAAARRWFAVMLETGGLDGLTLYGMTETDGVILALADAVHSYEHHEHRMRTGQGPIVSG